MGLLDLFTGAASERGARNNASAIQAATTLGTNALNGGATAALGYLLDGSGPSAMTALQGGYGRAREDISSQAGATQGLLGQQGALYDHMAQGGQNAYDQYLNATGANGAAGSAAATANFQSAPGYTYQRDQALDAVQRTAAARGGLAGGNTTADILKTATGLADAGYQQYVQILTDEQRRGLGAFRAALHQTEQAHQALPTWVSDLSRSGFDPNAVATGLFGSGVPGTRIGSANFAKGLKGFLGEDSAEWSGLRQAAIQNLTQPGGRTLTAAQEADRVVEFTRGKGARLAREMFGGEEVARLERYAAALRSTVLPSGIGSPNASHARTVAANLLNGLLGAIAFKSGVPAAAAAPFTTKAGQRILIGGPGAFQASRSFGGGAPRVVPEAPEGLQRLGQTAGRAAGLLSADGVPLGR